MTSPSARIAELEKALRVARDAIASLDNEWALGGAVVESTDGADLYYQYPIRDEIVATIDKLLTSPQGETSSRGGVEGNAADGCLSDPVNVGRVAGLGSLAPLTLEGPTTRQAGIKPGPRDPTPFEAEASALREALAAVERYDQGLASRYGFLREGGGNDDRMNDIACERIGVGKCVEILKRALTRQSAPAPEASQVSADAKAEIMRLMREDFDPTPANWEGRDWDDNAEDVSAKIIAVALSEKPTHISDAWLIVKRWLAGYEEEESAFSRYADHVVLDGVMTARERRLVFGTGLCYHCFEDGIEEHEERKRERIARENEY